MAIACALFAAFIAIQPKGATAVATEDQSTFVPATSATAPAALQQDPRAGDIAEEDQLVPAESVVNTAHEVSDAEYSPAA
jgi:hypothetical protein